MLEVGGDLEISDNLQLASLDTDDLTAVGALLLFDNPALASASFPSLVSTGTSGSLRRRRGDPVEVVICNDFSLVTVFMVRNGFTSLNLGALVSRLCPIRARVVRL